jgi:hypothetical protein
LGEEEVNVHRRVACQNSVATGSRCFNGLSLSEARSQGINITAFFNLKARLGGMDVSDAVKSKAQEAIKAKLKKLLTVTVLDNGILMNVTQEMVTRAIPVASGSSSWRTSRGGALPNVAGVQHH